jgi:acyl-CoA thioesterase-1
MIKLAHSVGLCRTLVAGLAAASCSAGSPSAPSRTAGDAPTSQRVLVVGDSLAVSPSRTDSFPADLQRRLDAGGRGWTVVNAGVSGAVSAEGLSMFDGKVTSDTRILILELGANDGLRGVTIATVEQHLSAIIERAQQRGLRVLLCGMETPPTHGWEYTLAFHNLFPRLASRYQVPLVPFLLVGVALNPDMNGPDGVHPNAAGARQIADTVWPYLSPLVGQAATTTGA